MFKVRFIVTRKQGGISNDDKILVETYQNEHDLLKVTYSTPDYRQNKTFLASQSRVLDYLEDVLYSLSRDTDPFSHFQLSTIVHPSVIYHVADLYDKDIRDVIMNMTRDSLRFHVNHA